MTLDDYLAVARRHAHPLCSLIVSYVHDVRLTDALAATVALEGAEDNAPLADDQVETLAALARINTARREILEQLVEELEGDARVRA
jgi:hypothetical protein